MAIIVNGRSHHHHPQALGIYALDAAVHSAAAAGAASLMTTFNPVTGAIFGLTYFIGSNAVNFLEKCAQNTECSLFNNHSTLARVMKFAIAFLSGIALAAVTCAALGSPIIFSVGSVLTGAMLATTMTIAMLVYNRSHAREEVMGAEVLSGMRC